LWGRVDAARRYDCESGSVGAAVSNVLPHFQLDEMDQNFLCNRVFSPEVVLVAMTKARLDNHKFGSKRAFDSIGNDAESSSQTAKKRRIG
jgi:hypothetical protein